MELRQLAPRIPLKLPSKVGGPTWVGHVAQGGGEGCGRRMRFQVALVHSCGEWGWWGPWAPFPSIPVSAAAAVLVFRVAASLPERERDRGCSGPTLRSVLLKGPRRSGRAEVRVRGVLRPGCGWCRLWES